MGLPIHSGSSRPPRPQLWKVTSLRVQSLGDGTSRSEGRRATKCSKDPVCQEASSPRPQRILESIFADQALDLPLVSSIEVQSRSSSQLVHTEAMRGLGAAK